MTNDNIKNIWISIWIDKRFHNLIRNLWDKREIKKVFWNWNREVALFLDRESAIRTPIDTWILRAKQRSYIRIWFRSTIQNRTWYWLLVHEWTKFQRSQPWMREAIEENEKEINTLFNKWVEKYFWNLTK